MRTTRSVALAAAVLSACHSSSPSSASSSRSGVKEAIHEASLLRFRPILMTTIAALLGALPLAVGPGIGSEIRRPLGISIVGGLIVSQLLTLFTTPVVYVAMDRFTRKRKR